MTSESIGLDLFGEPVYPDAEEAPRAEEKPSYGRRLTEAQRALAAQGLNPLTLQRGPEGRTCGECVHRVHYGGHAKDYPKCEVGPQTHGPKTDVRAWWPACPKFEAGGE